MAKFAELQVAVRTTLGEYGARVSDFYDYRLDTRIGALFVMVRNDIFEIFQRFDNVAAGRVFTRKFDVECNPGSGKWNFYWPASEIAARPIDELLRNWRARIADLVVYQPPPTTLA